MSRYVILEHDHPTLHWDLMLETGEVLRTWRLAATPEPAAAIKATYLAEHRRIYLDYEGPVSGDRGRVKRWDSGNFTWLQQTDNLLRFRLEGNRAAGIAELTHCCGKEWTLVLMPSASV
jgi:hypothetical protein